MAWAVQWEPKEVRDPETVSGRVNAGRVAQP